MGKASFEMMLPLEILRKKLDDHCENLTRRSSLKMQHKDCMLDCQSRFSLVLGIC